MSESEPQFLDVGPGEAVQVVRVHVRRRADDDSVRIDRRSSAECVARQRAQVRHEAAFPFERVRSGAGQVGEADDGTRGVDRRRDALNSPERAKILHDAVLPEERVMLFAEGIEDVRVSDNLIGGVEPQGIALDAAERSKVGEDAVAPDKGVEEGGRAGA